jgi:peptidoglycan/xylan/chitin deacetylase (PgdA/CDA1 family)
LRRARESGHEIGSHGHRHYKRSSIDAELFEDELHRSSQRLAGILDQVPAAFSYPFNSYLPGDKDICARYFQQVATVDGEPIARSCNPLEIPRMNWPGPARNGLRARRWLWTGRI